MRCNWQIRKRYFTRLWAGGGGRREQSRARAARRKLSVYCWDQTWHSAHFLKSTRLIQLEIWSARRHIYTIFWYFNSLYGVTPHWTLEMMDLRVRTVLTRRLQLNPASTFSQKLKWKINKNLSDLSVKVWEIIKARSLLHDRWIFIGMRYFMRLGNCFAFFRSSNIASQV